MSDRRIITDHILLRWLERAEGFDMAPIRAAMDRMGLEARYDGEILDFIRAHIGVDIDAIRTELLRLCYPAIRMKAAGVRHKGFFIKLHDGVAVTVVKNPARRSARLLS
jgi:hypothetical protein